MIATGHVHDNLDRYGYCLGCGVRVRTTFRGFPLPDRPVRLGHCTPTLGGHSALCDRDGRYCSLVSTHDGPCKPHGGA